jgi:hypothetical protein
LNHTKSHAIVLAKNNHMNTASFTIHAVTFDKVFIIDLDIGKSITNDAEAVVEIVNKAFPNRRIIYKDSCGQWDELVHAKGSFVGFQHYSDEIPNE